MKKKDKRAQTHTQFKRAELIFIWTLLALPILDWIIFWLYKNISSFVMAFQDLSGAWSLINFKNFYESLVAPVSDLGSFGMALKNTMKYFLLGNLVNLPLQLIFSYFLYKQIKGYKVFRIIFYFPVIISSVAMTGVFKEFISPLGPLGEMCRKLGMDFPMAGLLGQPTTATNTIMVYEVWTCVGFNMLLICGAMARIPTEVLEAARLDGIGTWRELVQIILPMIWSTLSTILILGATGILNSSGPILMLAPDTGSLGTTTVSYWIFDKVYANGGFMKGQYNLVSATGLCLTVVMVPIVLLLRRLIEKVGNVEY